MVLIDRRNIRLTEINKLSYMDYILYRDMLYQEDQEDQELEE